MTNGIVQEEVVVAMRSGPPSFKANSKKKTVTAVSNAAPNAATTYLIAAENLNRKAFTVYNNSTNSLYIGVEADVSAGNQIGQCGSNTTADAAQGFWGPVVYTGAIYAKRNTGSGSVTVYEFE